MYKRQACYSQNDAFYCKKDFYRLYGPKCQGCDYTIEMDQYSTKIGEDSFFHPECLVCSVCKLTVPSGHRVKYQDGFVYCEDHAFMCHMKTSSATTTASTVLPEMYERDSGIESDLSSSMGDHQQQQQHHGYLQQQQQQQQRQTHLQDLDHQQKSPEDGGCPDDKDGADSDDGKDDDDKGCLLYTSDAADE